MKVSEDQLNNFLIKELPTIIDKTITFEVLLKSIEVTVIKKKYNEATSVIYEDARRKHVRYKIKIRRLVCSKVVFLGGDGFLLFT